VKEMGCCVGVVYHVDESLLLPFCTETYIFDTYIFGPRTTNHLEGWHNKIKKKVHHAHPNIYLIIEVLQNIQALVTECTIIQYAPYVFN
jgi:hypothetical protein